MTPTDLLFSADRALRDAATDYSAEGFDEHEIRRREDALRQAARDYAAVADVIDAAAFGMENFKSIAGGAIARITAACATKGPTP